MGSDVVVIFIGRDPANRIDPALAAPGSATGILEAVACSPICKPVTQVVLDADPSQPSGYALRLDGSPGVKPAETYVLRFADVADAQRWLDALPRQQLIDKTVLVVDPASAASPGP